MSIGHPIFMAVFFFVLYLQRNLGKQLLSLNEKSPEWEKRGAMINKHRKRAYMLIGWAFAGMAGGLFTANSMNITPPFIRTYGHGIIGVLAIAALLAGFFLGPAIKKVVRPKVKIRFQTFHESMLYVVFGFGLFSLITGLIVLIAGPSALQGI